MYCFHRLCINNFILMSRRVVDCGGGLYKFPCPACRTPTEYMITEFNEQTGQEEDSQEHHEEEEEDAAAAAAAASEEEQEELENEKCSICNSTH